MRHFLRQLPKVELHLHIEGTLEPELMFKLARRNGITLPYTTIEQVKDAYRFNDLQGFLKLYYQGMNVLCTEQDFYDLAMAYFTRAHEEGVAHLDVHFDPQAHLQRGVALEAVMQGLLNAKQKAEQSLDLTVGLIMAFLRDRPAAEALAVLEQTSPFWSRIDAVGLDSAENGNPPGEFVRVFSRAAELGLARVAHAGEEGPADYIREALEVLGVERIDHGVRCLEDEALVRQLSLEQTVLTVCPLSNVCLGVVKDLVNHPLPAMLEAGLNITISSDDPAYFGGGMLANHQACFEAFGWNETTFCQLTRNAIEAGFMSRERRADLLDRLARLARLANG